MCHWLELLSCYLGWPCHTPKTITVGIKENFTIQSVDIVGNNLTISLVESSEFYVTLIEKSHECFKYESAFGMHKVPVSVNFVGRG